MRLGGSVLSPEGPSNINPSTADALPETRAVCVVLGWPGAHVYYSKLLTNPFLPPGSHSHLIDRHPHRADNHIDARGGRTTTTNPRIPQHSRADQAAAAAAVAGAPRGEEGKGQGIEQHGSNGD